MTDDALPATLPMPLTDHLERAQLVAQLRWLARAMEPMTPAQRTRCLPWLVRRMAARLETNGSA